MRFPCSPLGFASTGTVIALALCLAAPSFAQADAVGTNCLGPWPALDFAKLDACRPEPVSIQEKQSLLASLPERGGAKDLTEDQRRKLSALNAVLALHARKDVYVVKVIDVPQAWTGLYGRGVLLISAPLLKVVSSGELQALVAHEIGHEYSWVAWNSAQVAGQKDRMHEIELACDAIAVITLRKLGEEPKLLISALERVARFNSRHFPEMIDQTSHPHLQERRALIKQLSADKGN
jgi:Zn-dependent protease with chaperone function